MSYSDAVDYLLARLRTLPDLSLRVYDGQPDPLPITLCCIVEQGPVTVTQATFGASGFTCEDYALTIRLILAAADCRPARANALARPWPARLRALLTPDWTLGGTVTDSTLSDPASNLTSPNNTYPGPLYVQQEIAPELSWTLRLACYPGTSEEAA